MRARSFVDRDGGDVDADSGDRSKRRDRRERVARAAAEVHDHRSVMPRQCGGAPDERGQDRPTDAGRQRPFACLDCLTRIARLPRSPILRLQQVDVAASRDVERVPARTPPDLSRSLECGSALADRATKTQ
jgi:hypothetical protein